MATLQSSIRGRAPSAGLSLSLTLAILCGACSDTSSADPESVVTQPFEDPSSVATIEELDEVYQRGASHGQTYRLAWRAVPALVPNEHFEIDVQVFDANGARTEVDNVTADAAMPAHHHGMLRKPRTEKLGPSSFRVKGMLFHMPGEWELYLDTWVKNVSERTRFELEVE